MPGQEEGELTGRGKGFADKFSRCLFTRGERTEEVMGRTVLADP